MSSTLMASKSNIASYEKETMLVIEQPTDVNLDDVIHGRKSLECLRIAMQCEEADFHNIKVALRELITRYLDMNVPYKEQDCNRGKKFIERAKKEPLLKRYRDGWPIKVYAAAYMRRRVPKLHCKLLQKSKSHHRDQPASQPSTGPSRHLSHESYHTFSDTATKENVFTVSAAMRQFLASLSPRMDSPDHFERFWKAGIRNEDTLASFTRCNFSEKEMLYKVLQDLGVTPLELIALRRYFK